MVNRLNEVFKVESVEVWNSWVSCGMWFVNTFPGAAAISRIWQQRASVEASSPLVFVERFTNVSADHFRRRSYPDILIIQCVLHVFIPPYAAYVFRDVSICDVEQMHTERVSVLIFEIYEYSWTQLLLFRLPLLESEQKQMHYGGLYTQWHNG